MTATNCQVGTERSLLLLFCLLQILENQRLDWDKQIKFPLFGQMNWYLGFLSVCLDNTCLKIRSLDWNQLSHLVTFTIAVFVAPLEMEVVMMVWSDFWLKFESQNRSLFPQIMGSSHLLVTPHCCYFKIWPAFARAVRHMDTSRWFCKTIFGLNRVMIFSSGQKWPSVNMSQQVYSHFECMFIMFIQFIGFFNCVFSLFFSILIIARNFVYCLLFRVIFITSSG